MSIGWSRTWIYSLTAASLVASGCAQDGTLGRPATVGALKTSVGQLERDNDRLKKQLAELETSKSRLAEQLSQERIDNETLAKRLDSARTMLGQKGLDEPRTEDRAADADWSDDHQPRTTAPASRSSRSPRKPPFAQIGGGLKPVSESDSDDDETGNASPIISPKGVRDESTAPQSRRDDLLRWLPVATGAADSSPKG